MTRDAFDSELRTTLDPARVRRGASLGELTTFGVGGPAEWLVEVISSEEAAAVVKLAQASSVPVTILGGGSNVLVADRGVRGVVLRLRLPTISQPSSGLVRAGAGVTINGLVRWTIGRGLAGLEAWAGTPGTVGGAITGNAHYGGTDIGTLVDRVAVLDLEGRLTEIDARHMEFGYDSSRIQRTHEIVVRADFRVASGSADALRRTARKSLAHRKQTQPLALASAGCIFQNPDPARSQLPAGVPASAGALVDRVGLKGAHVGGARVSPIHANFIVNEGHATAADIRTLIEQARTAVHRRFGIDLKYEVVFLGEF